MMRLKGRMVVHDNRDVDRAKLRADCSSAYMIVIFEVPPITECLVFSFGLEDFKEAFIENGPTSIEVHL